MFHIAICDDEIEFIVEMKKQLKRYEQDTAKEFCITEYRDGSELLVNYQSDFDLIFMDIKIVPFYSASVTNIGSQLVAARSGYLPAWVDTYGTCFRRIIANRKTPKIEPMVEGYAGFCFWIK